MSSQVGLESGLVARLHMVNLAAKAIVALGLADDAAASGPARGARR